MLVLPSKGQHLWKISVPLQWKWKWHFSLQWSLKWKIPNSRSPLQLLHSALAQNQQFYRKIIVWSPTVLILCLRPWFSCSNFWIWKKRIYVNPVCLGIFGFLEWETIWNRQVQVPALHARAQNMICSPFLLLWVVFSHLDLQPAGWEAELVHHREGAPASSFQQGDAQPVFLLIFAHCMRPFSTFL